AVTRARALLGQSTPQLDQFLGGGVAKQTNAPQCVRLLRLACRHRPELAHPRIEEVLAKPPRHRHTVMAIDHVVLAPRAAAELVQVDRRQLPALYHRLADPHEPSRHRLASPIQEVAAQALPPTDAPNDLVSGYRERAAIDAGADAASLLHGRRAAPHRPVLA